MASQESLDLVYMQTALLHASLSKAARAKVGSCLVTKQGVCLTGYNERHLEWTTLVKFLNILISQEKQNLTQNQKYCTQSLTV